MSITIVPAPGLGDALIFQVAAHNLALHGFDAKLYTTRRFGSFFPDTIYTDTISDTISDTVFLQHDNKELSKELMKSRHVFAFYGSHRMDKHGPLRSGLDYVCHPDIPMVQNLVNALKNLFSIKATSDMGLKPPLHLTHRKWANRVILHTTSSHNANNWHKFDRIGDHLASRGFEPVELPLFPTLEELTAFIYESGYFLGNDSGPGHIASALNIPHIILGRGEKQMRLWRPGHLPGTILTPPSWAPLRYWKHFITARSVIHALKQLIENN